MTMYQSVRLLLHVALVAGFGESAKILILTDPTFSHCTEVSAVGHALLDRGHSVFILIGSTFNHKNCFDKGQSGNRSIEPIFTQDSPEVSSSEETKELLTQSMKEGEQFSMFTHLSLSQHFALTPCTNLYHDKEAIKRIEKKRFDLIVADTIPYTYCFFTLPVRLGIPYVAMSTTYEDFVTGRPFLPSIVPSFWSAFTDSMTFLQRLSNTITYIGTNLLGRFSQPMEVLNKINPNLTRQDLINQAAKCELYLHNNDPILSYPVPVMPNHVMIGGITAGPAKSLPPLLDAFYQTASKDIIVMTFGSSLGNMPNIVDEYLTSAFKRLDVTVISQHETESDEGSIKRLTWVPQNDLLGHPKTKLFVSHCGNNGVFEALYHGVPIVCTPIFGDQFYNGARVEKWGAGKMLPLLTSSEEEFYEAIHSVLKDPSYKKRMKRASKMYHSQPMTARERAAFWIEYVLKYGGGHLRSKASEMSTFVYMGYDILCFVVFLLGFFIILVVKCCQLAYRICWKKSEKVKTN